MHGREHAYVAPETRTETVLAQIWSQVLSLQRVGVQDNFFASGGNSLLALRVVWQVREVLGVQLPVRVITTAPTIARLARLIDSTRRVDASDGVTNLRPPVLLRQRREPPLPLSFQQEQIWSRERSGSVGSAHVIQSGVRLRGALNVTTLEHCFADLISLHETLRTDFVDSAGIPSQNIRDAVPLRLEQVDLVDIEASRRDAELARIVSQQRQIQFDLRCAPLLRAMCVRIAENDHILLLTVHEIVCDARALEVLAHQLNERYALHATGQSQSRPELPIQYADYAIWQRHWLQGDVLQRWVQRSRESLAGVASFGQDARDELASQPASRPMQILGGTLPAELSGALASRAKKAGVTLFTLLLTAFLVAMGRWRGQRVVTVGVPATGRSHWQTLTSIGAFESKLVVRVDIGDEDVSHLLETVDARVREAYALSTLPVEKLAHELANGRWPRRHGLFDTVFAWRDDGKPFPQETANLEWAWWPIKPVETLLDLSMTVGSVPDKRVTYELAWAAPSHDAAQIQTLTALFIDRLEYMSGDVESRVESSEHARVSSRR